MCYAIPGKIKEINEKIVVVDYFGEEKKALNEFYDLKIGDYICAQGGFVIKKVPEKEALETLEAWHELFFQLQETDLRLSRLDLREKNIDKKTSLILDKAMEGLPLKREDLKYLLGLEKPEEIELLFKAANFLRQKYHKNSCCVHGIIEVSNHCRANCLYCGIASRNKNLTRYRMAPEEIIAAAVEACEKYGFQALVLQSGEDPYFTPEILAGIIKEIKKKAAVLICVSFGETTPEGLEKLHETGSRAILMRFETSNYKLYERIRPGYTLDTRLKYIRRAYESGYIVMTGSLVGLPGQTVDDILNDIYLTKELKPEMYSFGPFLPHPDTPLANVPAGKFTTTLKVMALARLVDAANAKIAVTTALETLDPDGLRQGLMSGANSLMLNVTPLKYRKLYEIYPNKAHTGDDIAAQIETTVTLLKSLGRAPTDLGIRENTIER